MTVSLSMPNPGAAPVGARRAARLRAAIALPAAERRRIVAGFFAAHPGGGGGPLGLGRAVADFQEWEIASGRIADGGSAWWRAVNGLMVLDVRAAAAGVRGAGRPWGPATSWLAYGRSPNGDRQSLLWAAHQRSLHTALPLCHTLLRAEPAAERAFARLVVQVVDHAAAAGQPTGTSDLAVLTARHYPATYPISPEALGRLAGALAPVVGEDPERYRQSSIYGVG